MINEIRNRNLSLLSECLQGDERYIELSVIKMLLEDDKCFFKMSIEDAFGLLETLGYNNSEIIEIYSELISSENYYILCN